MGNKRSIQKRERGCADTTGSHPAQGQHIVRLGTLYGRTSSVCSTRFRTHDTQACWESPCPVRCNGRRCDCLCVQMCSAVVCIASLKLVRVELTGQKMRSQCVLGATAVCTGSKSLHPAIAGVLRARTQHAGAPPHSSHRPRAAATVHCGTRVAANANGIQLHEGVCMDTLRALQLVNVVAKQDGQGRATVSWPRRVQHARVPLQLAMCFSVVQGQLEQ